MRTKIAALLLVALAPFAAYAENEIYFNILNGDEAVTFTNQEASHVHPVIQDVAIKTFAKPFSPELVRSEYYQLTINKGIVWNGQSIVQYDYVPVVSDRFRNVFWLTDDGKGIIKTEIYDVDGRLVFGATCMGGSVHLLPPSNLVKLSMEKSTLNFFGFANIYSESAGDGTLRMSFTDGLNKFSVFRTPIRRAAQDDKERMIMYGNYVFNKIYGDYKYTVVGTVPYSKMEEIVMKVVSLSEEENIQQTVE